MRRENRAHILTRRVVTMLAKHYQPFGGLSVIVEISLDPYPGHLASLEHLLPFYDGNIIFRVASGYAGAAADASVEVYDHCPPIFFIHLTRIEIFGLLVPHRHGVIDVRLLSGRRHPVSLLQAYCHHHLPAVLEEASIGIGNIESLTRFFDLRI